jgi:hypothetical protein
MILILHMKLTGWLIKVGEREQLKVSSNIFIIKDDRAFCNAIAQFEISGIEILL